MRSCCVRMLSARRLHVSSLGSLPPVFLCPTLLKPFPGAFWPEVRKQNARLGLSRRHASTSLRESAHDESEEQFPVGGLPTTCPGCGAPSQTLVPNEAGFYSLNRSKVRSYLSHGRSSITRKAEEDGIYESVIQSAGKDLLDQLGLQSTSTTVISRPSQVETKTISSTTTKNIPAGASTPVCDRCHSLVHHSSGNSIYHPSVRSIEETISASPHKYNHIYHVVDAADFPMSVIPNLTRHLSLPRMRTQNRRSKSHRYLRGRVADVSFIITRSDLLAPKKEQVDTLMQYLVAVLRSSLGSSNRNVRLGNVRCVSAKRGWWTKEVKEDIWRRGGAGWLVGKVNVGKSNLFEAVFPKGRSQDRYLDRLNPTTANCPQDAEPGPEPKDALAANEGVQKDAFDDASMDTADDVPLTAALLLPPPQPEVQYPIMPIVSALPGTTASPIRVPFGNGKGELIDLPGLARSDLEKYVRPEHRLDLLMQHRVSPERETIKPGQSLLLGGLIRLTPITPGLVFMTHSFLALKTHITSTEKAIRIQRGEGESGVTTISEKGIGEKLASAGRFSLEWDVTKKQAGPLTARAAVGLRSDQLPFQVYAADILIEGCGWVEVVAQVRRKKKDSAKHGFGEENGSRDGEAADFPEIEVFSPEGRFIGVRKPMNAYLLGGKRTKKRAARPRRSIKAIAARARSAKS